MEQVLYQHGVSRQVLDLQEDRDRRPATERDTFVLVRGPGNEGSAGVFPRARGVKSIVLAAGLFCPGKDKREHAGVRQ